jgi:hypothetical protein
MTSPVIDLSGVDSRLPVLLDLTYYLHVEKSFDIARVRVLDTATQESTIVASNVALLNLVEEDVVQDTDSEGRDIYTIAADDAPFRQVFLDISTFAGRVIQLEFQVVSDLFLAFEGWYVDSGPPRVDRGDHGPRHQPADGY